MVNRQNEADISQEKLKAIKVTIESKIKAADSLLAAGGVTEAIQLYQQALCLDEGNTEISHKLAQALKQQGNLPAALAHYHQTIAFNQQKAEKIVSKNNCSITNSRAEHNNISFLLNNHNHQFNSSAAVVAVSNFQFQNNSLQAAQLYLEQAQSYMEEEKWQAAITACQKALKISVVMPEAYKIWGNILQKQGKLTEAMGYYAEALAIKSDYPEVYASVGSIYAEKRRWHKALAYYERAIALKPDWAKVYKNMAKVCLMLDKPNLALDYHYQAVKQDASLANAQEYYSIAERLLAKGEEEAAIDCYYRATELKPDWIKAIEKLANILEKRENWQESTKLYRRILEINAEKALVYSKKRQALPAQMTAPHPQKIWQKIQRYQQIIQEKSQSAEVYGNLGNLYSSIAQWQQAIAAYKQALQINPSLAGIYRNLSKVYWQTNQPKSAASAWYKSLELEPLGGKIPNYLKFAQFFTETQDYSKAVFCCQQGLKLESNNWQLFYQLGGIFGQQKNWEQAKAAYRQAIALNESFSGSYYSLGQVLTNLGEIEAALATYRQAKNLQPPIPGLEEKIAQLLNYQIKQDYQTAYNFYIQAIAQQPEEASNYEKALKIKPNNLQLHVKLGDIYLNQGKIPQALDIWRKARLLSPHSAELAEKIEQASSLLAQDNCLELSKQHLSNPHSLEHNNPKFIARLIRESKLFEQEYYHKKYRKYLAVKEDFLQHYLETGAKQGFDPNPLFNTQYYLQTNPGIKINPLAHYSLEGAKIGKNPHPLFDTAYYLEQNPDVADSSLNPLAHYLNYGAKEGRIPWRLTSLDKLFNDIPQETTREVERCLKSSKGQKLSPLTASIGIYCSSLGNFFMREIAHFLGFALEKIGLKTYFFTQDDQLPENLDYHLVVAPHEFFYLGAGESWAKNSRWLARTIQLNVEQPSTRWFSQSFYYLKQAALVFDINFQSAVMLAKMGLPAYFLPLGYDSSYQPFNRCEELREHILLKSLPKSMRHNIPPLDSSWQERPIDLHFVGTLSQRREEFFLSHSHWLSNYRCFWHIPPIETPLLVNETRTLDTNSVVGLSRLSKILLNIHRDELLYFEWHRLIFQGLWQKTLVVTEPCYRLPHLIPNQHYIECTSADLPAKINWLLNTPAGKEEAERVREAGNMALKKHFSLEQIMSQVQQILSQLA